MVNTEIAPGVWTREPGDTSHLDENTFLDVYGFAGGLTLGAVQAGMKLVQKYENAKGFGVPNMEHNRKLLGNDWKTQATDPAKWKPMDADAIFSNPPCSAFSTITNHDLRGIDSNINSCMHDLFGLAGKVAPNILVMESVQQAASQGLPLMRQLWHQLEEDTDLTYHCYHVLQSNHALGGAAIRKRYFLVLSRVPFGTEMPVLPSLATTRDVIGDLEPLPLTYNFQNYTEEPSDWVKREVWNADQNGMDGHDYQCGIGHQRELDLLKKSEWKQGEVLHHAVARHLEEHGELPKSWQTLKNNGEVRAVWAEKRLQEFGNLGISQTFRWPYDTPGRVITGKGSHMSIHPTQPRFFTQREVARILGFPDKWVIKPYVGGVTNQTWGKGVSVQAGRWIGYWVNKALYGEPGADHGVPVDQHRRLRHHGAQEREFVIDAQEPVLAR